LENHNQQLWNCRSDERKLNKCVFEKLVCYEPNFWRFEQQLTFIETGEGYTRYAEGRGASAHSETQHLSFGRLIYVYYHEQ
jgi:hypothetical protein